MTWSWRWKSSCQGGRAGNITGAAPSVAVTEGRRGAGAGRGDGCVIRGEGDASRKLSGSAPFPFVPGYDLVGIVTRLGPSVTEVAVGQRVAALIKVGGWTDYIGVVCRRSHPRA